MGISDCVLIGSSVIRSPAGLNVGPSLVTYYLLESCFTFMLMTVRLLKSYIYSVNLLLRRVDGWEKCKTG